MKSLTFTLILMSSIFITHTYASCTQYIEESQTDLMTLDDTIKMGATAAGVGLISGPGAFISAATTSGLASSTSSTIDEATILTEQEIFVLKILKAAYLSVRSLRIDSAPELAKFMKSVNKQMSSPVSEAEIVGIIHTVDLNQEACTNEAGEKFRPIEKDLLKIVLKELGH